MGVMTERASAGTHSGGAVCEYDNDVDAAVINYQQLEMIA
jgi:hypothetical protein